MRPWSISTMRPCASSPPAPRPSIRRSSAASPRSSTHADRVALDEVRQIDVELGTGLRRRGAGFDAKRRESAREPRNRHRQSRPNAAPSAGFAECPSPGRSAIPIRLTEMTGISVVADFRRRDVAAGGQGAPLLPVFHDQVFRSDGEDRVIANLGGIANITILTRRQTASPASIPVRPTACSMPGLRCIGQGFRRRRRVGSLRPMSMTPCCANCWTSPTCGLPPPKSTGRELFNMPWLE